MKTSGLKNVAVEREFDKIMEKYDWYILTKERGKIISETENLSPEFILKFKDKLDLNALLKRKMIDIYIPLPEN